MSLQTIILNESRDLNQSDINQTNTNYIIYGDYMLPKSISIPAGCILNFQGGSITKKEDKDKPNVVKAIVFNETVLMGRVLCKTDLDGTLKNTEIYSSWFYDNDSEIDLKFLTNFAGENRAKKWIVDNRIKFSSIDYKEIKLDLVTQMVPGGTITIGTKIELYFFGFEAGIYKCLEGGGFFRFLYTNAIYPQWFGVCGKEDVDSSFPLQQAFNSCRTAINGGAYTDDQNGCSKIYLPRGIYRCKNVDVYANCQVEGELAMAINGPFIIQKEYTSPALRIHCKNYTFKNYVLNQCYGIGSFTKIVFRGDESGSNRNAAPVIEFYSPQQSTELFNYPGDNVAADAGYTDFNFETCWFQFSPNACMRVNGTFLDMQLINCTFDVVTRGVVFEGTSSGNIRCINTHFFDCGWGGILIDTPNVVCCYIRNSCFEGCGGPANPDIDSKYSIAFMNPNGKGKILSLEDCIIEKYIILDEKGQFVDHLGGPLYIHAESITIKNNIFKDIDCLDYYKCMAIYSTNMLIHSNLFIISPSLRYEHARYIGILSQETPEEKHNLVISQNIFNFTKKGEPFEFIIASDFILSTAVITNNVTDDSTVPFISNSIYLSGSIVTLNGNATANVCHNNGVSLAHEYKKGDITINTDPKYNIGWFCQQVVDNNPKWAAFGAPVALENTTFGSSSGRPVFDQYKMQGFCYFDQTLNRPLWWTGTNWVDSDGTVR